MKQFKHQIITLVILILLTLISLEFVSWICRMAFENTCIELEEQYITTEVSETIGNMESAIDFGKELSNYYGIEEVLDRVSNLSGQTLKVVVLNVEAEPLYLSFEESEENIIDLANIYTSDYKEQLLEVTIPREKIALGDKTSLVFPIYQGETQLTGYMTVFYDPNNLIGEDYRMNTQNVLLSILASVSVLLIVLLVYLHKKNKEGKTLTYASTALIMLGMFCYIVFLFFTYRVSYQTLIEEKASQTAASVQSRVEELLDKGLDAKQLYRIESWLEEKEQTSESIQNIKIYTELSQIKSIEGTLFFSIGSGQGLMEVSTNQSYIQGRINLMTLTFGAVFVVCLMITFELTNLVEVLSIRLSSNFNKTTKEQYAGISAQIRLLSFIGYTAIYTSTPYAAVIMRSWDASVFGLSKAVSASLPLTVELVCVLAASALIQRVYKDMRLERFMIFVFPFLILGNLACTAVSSPYLLILLRAFCGIGFAFLKYWLNSIVSSGSEDDESFSINCGRLNAGLLGGITAGASLGAIFAQALGYQSNYMFTAGILLLLCVFGILTMPWKLFAQNRKPQTEDAVVENAQEGTPKHILITPKMLLTLIFGCIPLNIGLMYVVAFVPSYMDSIGQNAVATSYVYLVNGLAGVYLGMLVLNFMQKRSLYLSASLSLFLAAGGILILLVNRSLGIIMISAGILGLFDGFGTPSITSYFTGLTADKTQAPGMLTLFNMVGSAVQILCPALYNLMIQPNRKMTYLAIFGAVYVSIAVLFMILCRTPKRRA